MGVRTQETRIIKVTHGHRHRTDNNILIITRLDHVANRHLGRALMDTRIRPNMVRDKIFGGLEVDIPRQRDSHDLLLSRCQNSVDKVRIVRRAQTLGEQMKSLYEIPKAESPKSFGSLDSQ